VIISVTRTVRLKVKSEACAWLDAAAIEVNQVFNWCNATSIDAADRNRRANAKFLSGFDLCNLSAGASEYFQHIGADTIQKVCTEYATKRRTAKRVRLRWRVSRGSRQSLGWVPFKAGSVKRRGVGLRFCGKLFRVFDREYLGEHRFRDGCFAKDPVGDWWLCLPVAVEAQETPAGRECVGVDLGLKSVAVTSDGQRLEAGRFYRGVESKIAQAQRRGHKHHAKRLHRRAANRRKDALHQFSRKLVDEYQTIFVGDVSPRALAKTRMAKAVLDSGWGMLRTQLQYKGEYAGRCVEVIREAHTTRACSNCGQETGPSGPRQLVVRQWECHVCGVTHDRDVNAARNILTVGLRCRASVSGNESPATWRRLPRRSFRGELDQRPAQAA
jgi:putative transposase